MSPSISLPAFLVIAALAFGLAFFVRAVVVAFYGKWFRQGFMWDSALHYAIIGTLRRLGTYNGVPEFLLHEEPDTYPIAFHRFAALFSDALLRKRPYLPCLLVFSAGGAAFAVVAAYVAEAHFYQNGFVVGGVGFGLFMTLMGSVIHNGNSVLYLALSERLLARVLSSLFFLLLVNAMAFDDQVLFIAAVVAGALIGITSMFGRQTLWFVTPLLALLSWDWRPLLVMALAMLGSLLLDRGYYVRGVRHMYTFWLTYSRVSKHSRYVKSSLSRYVNWELAFGRRTPLNARITEMESHEPTQLIFRFPELFLLGAFVALNGGGLPSPVLALIGAVLVVYGLTSTAALRQFGEAARYIDYCLWMVVPFQLALYLVARHDLPMIVLLVGYFAFCLCLMARLALLWLRSTLPAEDRLLNLLAPLRLGPQHVFFPIPFTLGSSAVIRTAGASAIMCQGAAITPELYERYCDETPLLKRNWSKLFEQFGVTHVIALNSVLNLTRELVGWEYSFDGLTKVAEDDQFVVYARPGFAA